MIKIFTVYIAHSDEEQMQPPPEQPCAMQKEAQEQEAVMKEKLGPNYPNKVGPWDTEGVKDKPISNGSPKPGGARVSEILQSRIRHAVPGTEEREAHAQALALYSDGVNTLRKFDIQTNEMLERRRKLRTYLVSVGLKNK